MVHVAQPLTCTAVCSFAKTGITWLVSATAAANRIPAQDDVVCVAQGVMLIFASCVQTGEVVKNECAFFDLIPDQPVEDSLAATQILEVLLRLIHKKWRYISEVIVVSDNAGHFRNLQLFVSYFYLASWTRIRIVRHVFTEAGASSTLPSVASRADCSVGRHWQEYVGLPL